MHNTEARRAQLQRLENARGNKVVTYITGDRRGAETRIGMDVFPAFYEVLTGIGRVKKIDILRYSTGGLTMAAWGLANLIREFCDHFCVLIPFKAHSTATLLALGATEIVMGRMGQLSPVDPSITGPFNPTGPIPVNPSVKQTLPLSVEDALAYFKLAQEEAKIVDKAGMVEVFRKLSDTVQPMALGSVYRAKEQIKLLARKLLGFHMDERADKSKIDAIINNLTRELFSHDYLISRREAKRSLKLRVVEAKDDLEEIMWAAFSAYADAIEMHVPYHPALVLGGETEKTVDIQGAFIESADKGFVHRTTKKVNKLTPGQVQGMPAAVAYQEEILNQGWVKI